MSWIQTYSGAAFYPLAPRAGDVRMEDIAHALSLNCRFNGHCRTFYSVAEHCVRVSLAVPEEHAGWGLLHDAAEAYITDLPRPVKTHIPDFIRMEETLLGMILTQFGLSMPMPEPVAEADEALLATEQRDLMVPPPQSWGLQADPLPDRITPLPPQRAEEWFLQRFAELFPSHAGP